MPSWNVFVMSSLILATPACAPAPPPPVDAGSTLTDSGMVADVSAPTEDAGSSDTGVPCEPTPTDNFCAAENCNFRDIALPSCDEGGSDYRFYNQDFCTNQVTLIVIAAGWCVPCQMEAPMIEQLIATNPDYVGRVRVINVYGQNPDYTAPTAAFCNQWRARYGITSLMVTDPMGISQIYFPNQAYPSNMLVDRRGVIRYRAYGTSTGLTALRAQIDSLLAE